MPKIKENPLLSLAIQAVISVAIGVGGWYAKSTNDSVSKLSGEMGDLRVAVARLEERVKDMRKEAGK